MLFGASEVLCNVPVFPHQILTVGAIVWDVPDGEAEFTAAMGGEH